MKPIFSRTLLFFTCSVIGAGLLITACSDDEGGGEPLPAPMKRAEVVQNLANNVALPQYRACAENLALLNDAVQTWQEEGTSESLSEAREAWSIAYLSWQRCELLQLGPAGRMGDTVGGEGTRFEVYTYPQLSECFVDVELVRENWRESSGYSDLSSNQKGLGALEYLLFYDGDENSCNASQAINAGGEWDELSSEELNARRRAFAAFVASGTADAAEAIVDEWEGDGGYAMSLSNAGDGSEQFGAAQEALNEFSNAMVYFEKETKDMKLASPLGISTTAQAASCDEDICPELRESPWANESLAAVEANLAAFRELYYGGDGDGFDDLLRAIGAGGVADDMENRIQAAEDALAEVDGTLAEALVDDKDDLDAFYSATQDLVALFKTQFVNVLALELPNRAAADND